jgi:hypothetical protein
MSLLGIACTEAMKTPLSEYVQFSFRIWSGNGTVGGLSLIYDNVMQAPVDQVKIIGADSNNTIVVDIQSNFSNLTTANIANYPSKDAAILSHALATFLFPESGTAVPLYAAWFRPLVSSFPAPAVGWSRIWFTCYAGDHATPIFPTNTLIQIELALAPNVTGGKIPVTIY